MLRRQGVSGSGGSRFWSARHAGGGPVYAGGSARHPGDGPVYGGGSACHIGGAPVSPVGVPAASVADSCTSVGSARYAGGGTRVRRWGCLPHWWRPRVACGAACHIGGGLVYVGGSARHTGS